MPNRVLHCKNDLWNKAWAMWAQVSSRVVRSDFILSQGEEYMRRGGKGRWQEKGGPPGPNQLRSACHKKARKRGGVWMALTGVFTMENRS